MAIQEVANQIQKGDMGASIRNEIELMTSQLSFLNQAPPRLKSAETQLHFGNEVAFPEMGHDPNTIFERQIDQSNLLPVWFLEQGALKQRSVSRAVLTKPHDVNGKTFLPGTGWATGFMVSRDLLLTNNHVVPNLEVAGKLRFQFNFQLGADGSEQPTESFVPMIDGIFRTNQDLDYTLIQLERGAPSVNVPSGTAGERWGFIPLNEKPIFREDQRFNIIQHPAGRRKEIAVQNNQVSKLFENAVLYKTDTEPGSSGSPVFDNLWQIVALHHSGGQKDSKGNFINNAGIRIDKIVKDLQVHFAGQSVLTELDI